MKRFTAIAALLLACSSNPAPTTYTWGDASLETASAYCAAIDICSSTSSATTCTVSIMNAGCIADGTCAVPLEPAPAQAAVESCVDAIGTAPCSSILAGNLPAACAAAGALKP